MVITFNELRRIKDALPDGSIHKIAAELGMPVEIVRNYFGGANFNDGLGCGIHTESGPDGGVVELDDTSILDMALLLLKENHIDIE